MAQVRILSCCFCNITHAAVVGRLLFFSISITVSHKRDRDCLTRKTGSSLDQLFANDQTAPLLRIIMLDLTVFLAGGLKVFRARK